MMIYDYDLLSAISKVGRQNKTIPRAETVENQEKRKKKKKHMLIRIQSLQKRNLPKPYLSKLVGSRNTNWTLYNASVLMIESNIESINPLLLFNCGKMISVHWITIA